MPKEKSDQSGNLLVAIMLFLILFLAIGWSAFYHRSTIQSLLTTFLEQPEPDVTDAAPTRIPLDAQQSTTNQSEFTADDTQNPPDKTNSGDLQFRSSTSIGAQHNFEPNQPLKELETSRVQIQQQH